MVERKSELELDNNWKVLRRRKINYYLGEYTGIILSERTINEIEDSLKLDVFRSDFNLPDQFKNKLIDRSFCKLVGFAQSEGNPIAYQVLGVFIMESGGRMTDELKEKIPESIDKELLEIGTSDLKIFKNLERFKEILIDYKEGSKVRVCV